MLCIQIQNENRRKIIENITNNKQSKQQVALINGYIQNIAKIK